MQHKTPELKHTGVSTDLTHQGFNLVDKLEPFLFVLFALTVLLLEQPSTFGRLSSNGTEPVRGASWGEGWRYKAHLLCHLVQHFCTLNLPAPPFLFNLDQQRLRKQH